MARRRCGSRPNQGGALYMERRLTPTMLRAMERGRRLRRLHSAIMREASIQAVSAQLFRLCGARQAGKQVYVPVQQAARHRHGA